MNLLSNELTQALETIGKQVDHLCVPDLKALGLALQAERECKSEQTAAVLLQMQSERAKAMASFTQLLMCAQPDLSLHQPGHFESIRRLKELRHE